MAQYERPNKRIVKPKSYDLQRLRKRQIEMRAEARVRMREAWSEADPKTEQQTLEAGLRRQES